jgi:hypothetical protein
LGLVGFGVLGFGVIGFEFAYLENEGFDDAVNSISVGFDVSVSLDVEDLFGRNADVDVFNFSLVVGR